MRYLLGALARVFRVRAFVLKSDDSADGDYPGGVDVIEVPHTAGGRQRAFAAASSLISECPYSERLYRSDALRQAIQRATAREMPAWIVAHAYHLGPAALRAGAPCWIDFQNVDSQIWERVGATASSPLVRLFARAQAPRVAALERRLVASASGTSCVSSLDAEVLGRAAGPARPLVVPNGVDLSRYRDRATAASGTTIFFVGDLGWPPNADGLRWFRDRVWPLLRDRRDARVEILGRDAPADLLASARENFRYLGEGGDTRPHWEKAAVSIVPLRAGGGTRLKILEAAACGVPVVATTVGAEGLDLDPSREIAIADEPMAFANEVRRLLDDPAARTSQAAAARHKVEALYDWVPIGRAFAEELLRRGRQA